MIGRFRVLEIIGRGGAGAVCAGHDDVLDRRVAIKVLDPGAGGDVERQRTRLLREARLMASVSHPNVVPVFEAGVTAEGSVFVVMELVEGTTLREWLDEEPRPWSAVARMLRAAGEGLAAAHAAGVVHRDFIRRSDVDARTDVFGFCIEGLASDPEERPPLARILEELGGRPSRDRWLLALALGLVVASCVLLALAWSRP